MNHSLKHTFLCLPLRLVVSCHLLCTLNAINAVQDIEDLVTLGRKVKGCPYFASRSLARKAELIICPYNYLIDESMLAIFVDKTFALKRP